MGVVLSIIMSNQDKKNVDKLTIGQRIAFYRKQQGFTQSELAQKIGTTQHVISDYEVGRAHLNDDMVINIALTLKVSADILLGIEKIGNNQYKASLKVMKRLNRIEKLPPLKQKQILQTLDSLIRDAENKL